MASGKVEEEKYWSLLEDSQKPFYPDFISHLSAQFGGTAEEGRAAVIEYGDGEGPIIDNFSASRKLRRYLNARIPSGTKHRRVFVLEGLPRNFIQVLGANLRVPPSFFAAHWLNPAAYQGSLVNRTPRHHDRWRRCILSFQRLHQAKIKQNLKGGKPSPDQVYSMESSARRPVSRLTLFGNHQGPLSSSEQVSFWSSGEGASWDVVILVDSPLTGFVQGSTGRREVEHSETDSVAAGIMDGLRQQGSWYPPYNIDDAVHQTSHPPTPHMRSFFDDILSLFGSSAVPETPRHPADCLQACRRVVLLAWTAWLRITEAQIVQEQVKLYRGTADPHARRTAAASPSSRSPSPPLPPGHDASFTLPGKQGQFDRLMRAKTKLEALDAELYRNMDALGYAPAPSATTGAAVHGGNAGAAWEADAWQALAKEVATLRARLDIMTQAYTQGLALRESLAANELARQTGLLTSLATLFLPVSFVAAVFSMGGAFAAGERLSWVYWVIAVPIAGLGCVLLFTPLVGLVSRWWRRGTTSEGDGSPV